MTMLSKKIAFAILGVLVIVAVGALACLDSAARHDPARRYEQVRAALKAGDFKAANTEVSEIILKLANRTNEGWLDAGAAEHLPCGDIVYIDLLFSQASGGKFGFAAQREVLDALPVPRDDGKGLSATFERLVAFGEAVGWRRDGHWITYDDMSFSPATAPKGHLPVFQPENKIRAPFKWRDGSPETAGGLFDLLDERLAVCLPAKG